MYKTGLFGIKCVIDAQNLFELSFIQILLTTYITGEGLFKLFHIQ